MPDGSIFINEPMKKHTTFRIGGPADILVSYAGNVRNRMLRM